MPAPTQGILPGGLLPSSLAYVFSCPILVLDLKPGSLACSYMMLGIDLDEAWLWSQPQHEDMFVDTSYFPTKISMLPGQGLDLLTFETLVPAPAPVHDR